MLPFIGVNSNASHIIWYMLGEDEAKRQMKYAESFLKTIYKSKKYYNDLL